MKVEIAPMQAEFIEGFRRAVDILARERKFLTFLEAPDLPDTRAFVALAEGAV